MSERMRNERANATQTPSRYGHMAKVSRPLSMGTWQYAEGRKIRRQKSRDETETRKGHPGVESAVQRVSCLTPTHKPPGLGPVSGGLFHFFPPFRVLPCAHTEQSANFSHLPIPAGSLGCCMRIMTLPLSCDQSE